MQIFVGIFNLSSKLGLSIFLCVFWQNLIYTVIHDVEYDMCQIYLSINTSEKKILLLGCNQSI